MSSDGGVQPLTTRGNETAESPQVTSITQRPSTGSRASISKKANPGNSPTAASGASNHLYCGASSVGGLISMSTRRSESLSSGRVSTTRTNRANRSGPTVNLESTPPCTLSLLSTVAAASARKAPVIITRRTYRERGRLGMKRLTQLAPVVVFDAAREHHDGVDDAPDGCAEQNRKAE